MSDTMNRPDGGSQDTSSGGLADRSGDHPDPAVGQDGSPGAFLDRDRTAGEAEAERATLAEENARLRAALIEARQTLATAIIANTGGFLTQESVGDHVVIARIDAALSPAGAEGGRP